MVNINKLKGKIVECEFTVTELARKVGINHATLYRKLKSDGKDFTIQEADRIAKELKLSPSEASSIFFSQYVA